tara:strand:- start:294 stop:515 length:222 start_codon:yes stop_codon:yes gene_type:complete
MAKGMTTEQALRGGKYVLRKKKAQSKSSEDKKKPMGLLLKEGSALAKSDKLNKKGEKIDEGDMDEKAKTFKYA